MKLLITLLLFLLSGRLLAVSPADVQEWIRDGKPESLALAQRYLLKSNAPIEDKVSVVLSVLNLKQSQFYTDVLSWFQNRPNLAKDTRVVLRDKIVARIADDGEMQRLLRDGVTEGLAQVSGFVTTAKQEGGPEIKRLRVAMTEEDFILAAALKKSGALAGIKEVQYNNSTPVKLEGQTQLEWRNFPEWVVKHHQASLFSRLEAYRKELLPKGTDSNPSRLEVTKSILAFIEEADGKDSPEGDLLRAAIRNSLVKSEAPRYTDAKEPSGTKLSTLTINLMDSSDLLLARMLLSHGDLKGVEVVNWNGVNERHPTWTKVNYPTSNQVVDVKGRRIGDILGDHFVAPPQGGLGLWRDADLLKYSQTWHPTSKTPVAGNCDPLKAVGKNASTTKKAGE